MQYEDLQDYITSLEDRIYRLEEEDVVTSNLLYELENRLTILEKDNK